MRGLSQSLKICGLAAICFATLATTAARAETLTFDWTLSDPSNVTSGGFSLPGSGVLTVTTGTNGDTITSMTGELGGNAIISLLPAGTSGSDNLLFPVGTKFTGGTSVVALDTDGIVVSTAVGNIEIFGAGSPFSKGTVGGNDIDELGGGEPFGVGTLTLTEVAAVPEASTWAMMVLGFVGLGFVGYRKQRGSLRTA